MSHETHAGIDIVRKKIDIVHQKIDIVYPPALNFHKYQVYNAVFIIKTPEVLLICFLFSVLIVSI